LTNNSKNQFLLSKIDSNDKKSELVEMVDKLCFSYENNKDTQNDDVFVEHSEMDDESVYSIIEFPQLFKYYEITYIA